MYHFVIYIIANKCTTTTTLVLSGVRQVRSGERQRAVDGNAFDHLAIRAGPEFWEAVSN